VGGEDLAFPHHEDEIAQSEGAALQPEGRPFVKYWVHCAHLLVEGKKMSKSLGNFFTVRDLFGKGYSGREIRYLLLKGHYRETFNFTLAGLEEARAALGRLDECLSRLLEIAGPNNPAEATGGDRELLEKFTKALDDDLNVSAAWGAVFDWVRESNRRLAAHEIAKDEAASALAAWDRIDQVFGLGRKEESDAPPEIQQLLEQRQAARKAKEFKRADGLREELKSKGWMIEDTPKGPRLKRI
jgi:cysteinyl-tRNA synthetase